MTVGMTESSSSGDAVGAGSVAGFEVRAEGLVGVGAQGLEGTGEGAVDGSDGMSEGSAVGPAGVGEGLFAGDGGAMGTVGVVGFSGAVRRRGSATRAATAQTRPAPAAVRSIRRRNAPRRIAS
ncbi:hypothetical protein ACFYWX_47050 [Streptomyces sp. NPDC002888]|uniref:hypothetical protein n=1 Tax=Streptomyces sp. NPDC002888 TaxID=3364668 RepID=UPI00368BF931